MAADQGPRPGRCPAAGPAAGVKSSAAAKKVKQYADSIETSPLTEEQAKDVLKAIRLCTTDELLALDLGPPPKPVVPSNLEQLHQEERLRVVQRIICSLHYNHYHGYHFNVSKRRPLAAIVETAAHILKEGLPIKCIEAVFLGLAFTCGWRDLERIPMGFKSRAQANGQEYRHIVLVIYSHDTQMFGALGLSRRAELMDKPLVYASLADLVAEYRDSYARWWHELVKVRVGLPAEHDPRHTGPMCWRYCNISLDKRPWPKAAAMLNHHAEVSKKLQAKFNEAAAAAASAKAAGAPTSPRIVKPGPHRTRPYAASSAPGTVPLSPRMASPLRQSTSSKGATAPQSPRTTVRPSSASSGSTNVSSSGSLPLVAAAGAQPPAPVSTAAHDAPSVSTPARPLPRLVLCDPGSSKAVGGTSPTASASGASCKSPVLPAAQHLLPGGAQASSPGTGAAAVARRLLLDSPGYAEVPAAGYYSDSYAVSDSSSDEEQFDSDSECNSVVVQLRRPGAVQLQHCV